MNRIPYLRLFGANSVQIMLTFAASIVAARALSPEARGDLAGFVAWTLFGSEFCLLGSHVVLAKLTKQGVVSAKRAHNTILKIAIPSTAATAAILILLHTTTFPILSFLDSFEQNNVRTFTIAALFTAALLATAINAGQIQVAIGSGDLLDYTASRLIFSATYLLSLGALYLAGVAYAFPYVVAFATTSVVTVVATRFLTARSIQKKAPSKAQSAFSFRSLVHESKRYAVATVIRTTGTQIDKILISILYSPKDLGLYIVAFSLSQAQSAINQVLAPIFFERSASTNQSSSNGAAWIARRLRQTVALNIASCAFACMAAPILITPIFGDAYKSSVYISLILIPAFGIKHLGRPFEEILRAVGRPVQEAAAGALNTAVFVVLATIIHTPGTVSTVAVAALVANTTSTLLLVRSVATHYDVPITQILIPNMNDALSLLAYFWRKGPTRKSGHN